MFPSNEEETIALFRLMQDRLGWRIVHQQTQFPDLIIENGDGAQLLAEAEHSAYNFRSHNHDPKGCDLIICYHNNWPDASLPVWALEDLIRPRGKVGADLVHKFRKLCREHQELRDRFYELEQKVELLEIRVNFLRQFGFYQQIVGEHSLPYNLATFYTNTELDFEQVERFFDTLFRLPHVRAIAGWLQSAEIPSRCETKHILKKSEFTEVNG